MALFCDLNTTSLPVELPQKIIQYVMIEWMYEKYIICRGRSIIKMDIGLNEMWPELNWFLVEPSSVNILKHH